jgi:hypothetical protein
MCASGIYLRIISKDSFSLGKKSIFSRISRVPGENNEAVETSDQRHIEQVDRNRLKQNRGNREFTRRPVDSYRRNFDQPQERRPVREG